MYIWLKHFAPILRIINIVYFKIVHFSFWIYNYLFKEKVIVPRPIEDELNQLLMISATQAAEMIRKREITSTQLIEVYIRRICAVNPALNVIVQKNFEEALAEAKMVDDWLLTIDTESQEYKNLPKSKPLLGVPFTAKDSIRIRGLKNCVGIPALEKSEPNEDDSAVVDLMRSAGAIPLAQTNVPEACLWWQTCNHVYGTTNSPFDSRRGVGGSSGGEGCLITAAGSVIGIGSDIGGSIRIPAFFNGVFGLKPSSRMIPSKGHIPDVFYGEQEGMFSIGPICRYARDLSTMLKVMLGPEQSERLQIGKSVKLGKTRFFYSKGLDSFIASPLHKDCENALKKTVKYFETKYDLHAYHVNLPITHHALALWMTCMHSDEIRFSDTLAGYKPQSNFNPFWEMLLFFLGQSRHTFMALLTACIDDLPNLARPDRNFVLSKRTQLKQELTNLLGSDGVLVFPGFARPAYYHNEAVFSAFDYQYTALFNTVDLPVLACPLGLNSEGVPVGVQIVGGPGSENTLINIAQDLEEGFGGWKAPARP